MLRKVGIVYHVVSYSHVSRITYHRLNSLSAVFPPLHFDRALFRGSAKDTRYFVGENGNGNNEANSMIRNTPPCESE